MFTGIIRSLGTVKSITPKGSNLDIWIQSAISEELQIDQSVAHNGICLTIVELDGDSYRVTAVDETVKKTNISSWKSGDCINLELAMQANQRLDGHMVQGHVDLTATCVSVLDHNGSWQYTFTYPKREDLILVEKGSVCVNGVSLTVVNSKPGEFSVAIIPYTYYHTNFQYIKVGTIVNLEFDIIGKYVIQYLAAYKAQILGV